MERGLKSAVDQMLRSKVSFKDAVAAFKKRYVQKALESSEGDAKRAAKQLGMSRDGLRGKAKKYKVKLKLKKKPAKQSKRGSKNRL